MPTIGSASNNSQGYFSTKVSDRAQREKNLALAQNIQGLYEDSSVHREPQKALLNWIYQDLASGIALPKNLPEMSLLYQEQLIQHLEACVRSLQDHAALNQTNEPYKATLESKEFLEKHLDKNSHYDVKSLWEDIKRTKTEIDPELVQRKFEQLRSSVQAIFKKNPKTLFEKAAAYPETVRRLVDVINLPVQNEKGWNLASQAAKAGNPKLVKAFEKAGFGPNLHTKAVVDFAKAMTEGSNCQKSAALKELMGITPLS
ncbi:hypothetical protein [Vampirovibrio chlorellavorus]|uniref:hypothetical protein n=1 Tax=Vampirovibrio chlorellavorus TaxID=758823 RepID=UPI0026EE836D|nr:hypothetical protein [Vampirovibrio chlorellavorus]